MDTILIRLFEMLPNTYVEAGMILAIVVWLWLFCVATAMLVRR